MMINEVMRGWGRNCYRKLGKLWKLIRFLRKLDRKLWARRTNYHLLKSVTGRLKHIWKLNIKIMICWCQLQFLIHYGMTLMRYIYGNLSDALICNIYWDMMVLVIKYLNFNHFFLAATVSLAFWAACFNFPATFSE